jgi:hypothetical protein
MKPRLMPALGQVLPSRLPAAMSAAEGEAAETAGKRTSAASNGRTRLTAAVPGAGTGRRLLSISRHSSRPSPAIISLSTAVTP